LKDAFDDIEVEEEEEEDEEDEEEEESGGGAEEEAGRGAEESDFLFTSRGDACTGELEAQPILKFTYEGRLNKLFAASG